MDVKVIEKPDLDAKIVAKQIASALERGYNYKKIGNLALKRIIDAGAIGAEIIISGKLGGGKGLTSKFIEGYLKHCGQPSKELVDHGFEEAQTRPGKIGISVKIMKEFLTVSGEKRTSLEKPEPEKPAEKPKEEKKEKPAKEAAKKPAKKSAKKPAKKAVKKTVKKPAKKAVKKSLKKSKPKAKGK